MSLIYSFTVKVILVLLVERSDEQLLGLLIVFFSYFNFNIKSFFLF